MKAYVILYWSAQQTPDQFGKFPEWFEELLSGIFKLKSFLVLITSDFNCRNSNGFLGDTETAQGTSVHASAPFYGLQDLIKKPSKLGHLYWPSVHQPTQLLMESYVHGSPCSICHRQVVFAKMNLKVEYLQTNILELHHTRHDIG